MKFPWRRMMTLGFGVLRLSPDQFWNMTLREFACAMAAFAPEADHALDRGDLDALMKQFPDRT